MELKIKIYLEDKGEKFMGIGVLWLLQNLEKEKSLRAAAASMNISYSKAYNMVTGLEKALGCRVVERQRGGFERSGAFLTEFGKAFIKLYDGFQNECKKRLDEPFAAFREELAKLSSQI